MSEQILIKRTASTSAINPSLNWDHVGRIVSKATMLKLGFRKNELNGARSKNANRDFIPGWLKRYPTLKHIDRDIVTIEEQYEYGVWAKVIYGEAV